MKRGTKCIYQTLDNGIHEFVFLQPSHAAVDEFIEHLDWIVANEPVQPNTTGRTLMDTCQSGALPMYYIAKRANEWTKRQAQRQEIRNTRTAQLYNTSNAYVTIARNLGKVFTTRQSKQEYFQNDRNGAIAWLLKED